ncbi:jg4483, partial [Pararge aegeria aegeria]
CGGVTSEQIKGCQKNEASKAVAYGNITENEYGSSNGSSSTPSSATTTHLLTPSISVVIMEKPCSGLGITFCDSEYDVRRQGLCGIRLAELKTTTACPSRWLYWTSGEPVVHFPDVYQPPQKVDVRHIPAVSFPPVYAGADVRLQPLHASAPRPASAR